MSEPANQSIIQSAISGLKVLFALRTFPWCFMAIFWAATFLQIFSHARGFWIYDRNAIAAGEWWRLFTGHWIHFGWFHYAVDAGLFLLIGRCLEYQWPKSSRASLALMSLMISGGIFFFDTEMIRYAGLSGLNVGFLVFLSIDSWRKDHKDWFWPAVLVLHILELWLETAQDGQGGAMVPFDDPTVKVATSAHVLGVAYALAWWLSTLKINRRAAPDQSTIKT